MKKQACWKKPTVISIRLQAQLSIAFVFDVDPLGRNLRRKYHRYPEATHNAKNIIVFHDSETYEIWFPVDVLLFNTLVMLSIQFFL